VFELIIKMSWIFCFISLGRSLEYQRLHQPLLPCPKVVREIRRCTL